MEGWWLPSEWWWWYQEIDNSRSPIKLIKAMFNNFYGIYLYSLIALMASNRVVVVNYVYANVLVFQDVSLWFQYIYI